MSFSQTTYLTTNTQNNFFDDLNKNVNDIFTNIESTMLNTLEMFLKSNINNVHTTYTRDNTAIELQNSITTMVGEYIIQLNNISKVIRTLNEIETLEHNWNENGAQKFSKELLDLCRRIVLELPTEPFVCPTACDSIQFEYTNKNNDYLEFEIFSDHTEMYIEKSGREEEKIFEHKNNFIQMLRQVVVDFYE